MIIGIILVKRESKRFPNKHFAMFNGAYLFEHCLLEIMRSERLEAISVISNDSKINAICTFHDIAFINESEELAKLDEVYEVIKEILPETGGVSDDIIVLVPTTAPLREAQDIDDALAMFIPNQSRNMSVISVSPCTQPPQWSFKINNGLLDVHDLLMTSQELTPHYYLNGAIYISTYENLKKNKGFFSDKVIPYIMPKERSIDIDYKSDLEIAQIYFNIKHGLNK